MIDFLNVDCLDYMSGLTDKVFDLAIVDPPYGNKSDCINVRDGRDNLARRKVYHGFNNVKPNDKYFSELFRVSKNQIIFGGNFFGLVGGYICWAKNGTAFGEAELAWCSMQNSVSFYEYTWNGMIQQDMKNKELRIHPNQKPVDLYKRILTDYAKPGWRILDTHAGSMSLAVACFHKGIDAVFCEIDKIHFDAGLKRFNTETTKKELFS